MCVYVYIYINERMRMVPVDGSVAPCSRVGGTNIIATDTMATSIVVPFWDYLIGSQI